jgi:ribosomal protein S12 methylthiotransferase accessory factor YcaO
MLSPTGTRCNRSWTSLGAELLASALEQTLASLAAADLEVYIVTSLYRCSRMFSVMSKRYTKKMRVQTFGMFTRMHESEVAR